MADKAELTQEDKIESTETEQTESTETTQVKAIEKKFTQSEVEDLIKRRVEKEKRAFKSDKDAWDAERQELLSRLDEMDAEYADEVEELSKGLSDDAMKEFITDDMSNREKVRKLKVLAGFTGKPPELPETKKGTTKEYHYPTRQVV